MLLYFLPNRFSVKASLSLIHSPHTFPTLHSFHCLDCQQSKMFAHLIYTTALALSIATINCAPQPRDNSLPDCAAAPAECKCPAGTTLQPSSTYALIGASAKDVKTISGSCEQLHFDLLILWKFLQLIFPSFTVFETAWFGASPQAVSGYDNKPGATRTFNGSTSVGTYTFVEKVSRWSNNHVETVLLTNVIAICSLSHTKNIMTAPSPCYSSRTTVDSYDTVKWEWIVAHHLLLGPIPYKNGTGSFSGYWDTLSVKYADAHETLIYWDIYVCWTGVVSGAYSRFLKNSELRTYGMYGQQITTLSMKARSTTSLRFSSLKANCWAIASRLCHFNFGGTVLVGWLATCF